MTDNTNEISFNVGDKILFNNKTYFIKAALSLDVVLLGEVDTECTKAVKITDLISGIQRDTAISFSQSSSDIIHFSETDWAEAKRRETIIRVLAKHTCTRFEAKRTAQQLGISERYVYKLIQRYRKGSEKLTALLPTKPPGGKGKGRLSIEVDAIIKQVIQELYLNKQKLTVSSVVEEIRRQCICANLKPPCINAVRQRIDQLTDKEIVLKRQGVKDMRKNYAGISNAFPVPEFPLAILQIDHTLVDIIVVDEIHRKPMGRPYLTVAIDTFSRCITGFYLTLDAPSAVSVGLCITHSVFDKEEWLAQRKIETEWPIWGKPDCIYVDNAAEFHSEALQRGCDVHGIKIEYRPLGKPHYGGIVERVIGTLMQLIHQLPGTTFSNCRERGEYPSERKATLTLSELEHWLTIAIVDYYHQKLHSHLHMPPIAKYKLGILGDTFQKGRGYPPRIINKRAFLIDFLPLERRTLQRHGFKLDHIAYFSNALNPLIANRKRYDRFIIRRDPRDFSRIYVVDPISHHYLEISYRTLSRPTITLWEHRQAFRVLKEQGVLKRDEAAIFRTVERLRSITQAATARSKAARRKNERLKKTLSLHQNSHEPTVIEAIKTESVNLTEIKPFTVIETW
jgi:putative transposase